jgi:uncharacterized membrane protein
MNYFAAYIAALIVFILADAAWLTTMVPRFYRPILGDLLLSGVNLTPAVIFYLLYPVGLVVFAISPALKNGSVLTAGVAGTLFGLFTYGTYNLTNQATLRNWSALLSMVDMAWGSILGAVTAAAAYAVVAKFLVNP